MLFYFLRIKPKNNYSTKIGQVLQLLRDSKIITNVEKKKGWHDGEPGVNIFYPDKFLCYRNGQEHTIAAVLWKNNIRIDKTEKNGEMTVDHEYDEWGNNIPHNVTLVETSDREIIKFLQSIPNVKKVDL